MIPKMCRSNWPTLAALFDAIITGDVQTYAKSSAILQGTFAPSNIGFPSYNGPEALQGIRCGKE